MKLGDYEIRGEIGRGAMGSVHRGEATDGRAVAIKVLSGVISLEARARFEREHRVQGSFTEEQGFVPLLEVIETPRGAALVMPLIEGGTLRARLAKGPLGIEETARIGEQLASALGRAHAKGVVHRDLKPENVLFTHHRGAESGGADPGAGGRALVADLGLAKHFRHDLTGASQSVRLSKTGELRGTAGYMPPEQMNDAGTVGPPSDVFALGAILYECLAGSPAFHGETILDVLTRTTACRPDPVSSLRPETPAWLAAVVHRALAADPGARFADGAALAAALAARGRAGARRGVSGAPAVAALVVLGGLVALLGAVASRRAPPLLKPEPIEPAVTDTRSTPRARPDAVALAALADREAAASRFSAAIAAATSAIEADRANPAGWVARGAAQLARHDAPAARRDLEEAVRLAPGDHRARALRGEARLGSKDPDAACEDFEAVIATAPKTDRASLGRAHLGIAKVKLRAIDYDGALASAERAVRAAPELAEAYEVRGLARTINRDGDLGADVERAMELNPRLLSEWASGEGLVELLVTREAARRAGQTGFLRRPEAAWPRILRAAAKVDLDQPGGLVDAFDATRAAPQAAAAWALLARAQVKVDRQKRRALAHAEKAVELDPLAAASWSARALVRLALDELPGASRDAGTALELNARDPTAWIVKARLRAIADDLDGAIADLTSYCTVAASSELAALVRERIAALQPASTQPDGEYVWFDDESPVVGDDEPNWVWVKQPRTPFGALAFRPTTPAGTTFNGLRRGLGVRRGEKLFVWVFMNPRETEPAVALEWLEPSGERHAALWASKPTQYEIRAVSMGRIVETGAWTRLEVSAAALGLEERFVTGMSFHVLRGVATFDHVGKR